MIDALERALVDRGLRLSVEPDCGAPGLGSYRRIRLEQVADSADALPLIVPVDDEFDDASDANQPLLLHLVLAECEAFAAADGFAEWASESELDVSDDTVRALYDEVARVVPLVREVIGPQLKAIPVWDFTLNAGAARALRERGDVGQ